jgi:hypothetical protein
VFKFGFFVITLSSFLMLGTLGVHELGHSLAAQLFGCAHQTDFGMGFAVTHVECASNAGFVWIALAGFLLTALIALVIHLTGHAFSKRISWLLLGFAILIAVDDFETLHMTNSGLVLMVLLASGVIVYSIVKVVKAYELEYARHESRICAMSGCERQSLLNSRY